MFYAWKFLFVTLFYFSVAKNRNKSNFISHDHKALGVKNFFWTKLSLQLLILYFSIIFVKK